MPAHQAPGPAQHADRRLPLPDPSAPHVHGDEERRPNAQDHRGPRHLGRCHGTGQSFTGPADRAEAGKNGLACSRAEVSGSSLDHCLLHCVQVCYCIAYHISYIISII